MKPGPRFAGLFVLAVICSLPEDFAQAAPMAAIVAKYSIDLNGNGITVDSYDSTDPAKSNNGHYDSSHYSGDMGDIASNDGIANALSIGNAKIYGRAHVGPGGTIFVGPSGAIGEHWWQASNSGIEPGWFAADANYTCPDVSFPYQASNPGVQTWTEPGDVVSTNISYVTNFVISTNFPNPLPWGGVVTNIGYFTTTTLPDPPPAGLVTNTVSTTTRTFPAPGTYVGSITTNHITSGPIQNQGYWYIFNRITSYSYPVYYFSFNLYVTNTVWATNHYDNLLIAGASYFLSSLTGSTYVAGMDVRLVVANGIDLAYPFTIPQGSAVKVWSGGTSLVLTANQSFNQSGHAGVFVIYCADSVTSITANGSAQFNGVIFAPNANLTASTGV